MKRLALMLLLLASCAAPDHIELGNRVISIERAVTAQEQARGLMYRTQLCENCGMLFVFDSPQIQSFWMKNTSIPLDIIFLDSEMRAVRIHHAAPCESDPCKTYSSGQSVRYALEVNINAFNDSVIGQKAVFR
ncbi:MAG: DUF192 domain-containing protein [archaeon]